jgi:hypothetical protein
MNKALFIRKAANLTEIIGVSGEEKQKSAFIIEKVIELSKEEYKHFCNNLLEDYDFIAGNVKLMYVDMDDVRHCLLVKEVGSTYGVLIDSQGYDFPRYAAYYELLI